ncbi:MAG: hypothetical protein UZ06_CHB003000012 [Chlorobi bacterium OLB6]|nr:MAG: hypothetical protein UZ06_CHB003000012 [Chlorobi bacterium OLB6]
MPSSGLTIKKGPSHNEKDLAFPLSCMRYGTVQAALRTVDVNS